MARKLALSKGLDLRYRYPSMADLPDNVGRVLSQISDGDYSGCLGTCPNSRVTPDELRSAIESYPDVIGPPPPDFEAHAEIVHTETGVVFIDLPLWSEAGEMTDLTLKLEADSLAADAPVRIIDVRVL